MEDTLNLLVRWRRVTTNHQWLFAQLFKKEVNWKSLAGGIFQVNTPSMTSEQRAKPFIFAEDRGWNPTQSYMDYNKPISHFFRIPMQQSLWHVNQGFCCRCSTSFCMKCVWIQLEVSRYQTWRGKIRPASPFIGLECLKYSQSWFSEWQLKYFPNFHTEPCGKDPIGIFEVFHRSCFFPIQHCPCSTLPVPICFGQWSHEKEHMQQLRWCQFRSSAHSLPQNGQMVHLKTGAPLERRSSAWKSLFSVSMLHLQEGQPKKKTAGTVGRLSMTKKSV